MESNELNILAQLIESMILAANELEKSINKKDTEKTTMIKKEILNFRQEIDKLLR